MTTIEISDLDIIKIIVYAFSDIYDTVRVEATKDYFKIFGVDESKTIYAELELNKDAFASYDFSTESYISVDCKEFTKKIGLASSPLLTEFESTTISFQERDLIITIYGRRTTINEKIPNIPTGIKEAPPLPDFSQASKCLTDVTPDIRLAFMLFGKTKEGEEVSPSLIQIKIDESRKNIKFKPIDPISSTVFELKGKTIGEGKTYVSSYSLNHISRVGERKSLNELEISVINEGNIKFSYFFDVGKLTYIVAKMMV